MSTEKAFPGQRNHRFGENQMKRSITLLVLATVLGIVAMGCDPAPKDEATTPAVSTDVKTAMPHATAPKPGAGTDAKTTK